MTVKAENGRTEKGFGLALRRVLFRNSAFRSTGSTFSKVLGVQPREERLDDGGRAAVSPGAGAAAVEGPGGTSSELFLARPTFPWPSSTPFS